MGGRIRSEGFRPRPQLGPLRSVGPPLHTYPVSCCCCTVRRAGWAAATAAWLLVVLRVLQLPHVLLLLLQDAAKPLEEQGAVRRKLLSGV